MSAQLPPHPSLENLKKQAKSLHKAHRSGDSEAADRIKTHLPRLADASAEEILQSDFSLQEAQLVVAREYGFPSWPRLVEAVSQAEDSPITPEPQPEETISIDVVNQVEVAPQNEDSPTQSESLSDNLKDLLTRAISRSEDDATTPEPPSEPLEAAPSSLPQFTNQVKKVLELARSESFRLGHNYIGTEHLLLGIVEDGKGAAIEILTHLGLNLNALKQSVEDYTSSHGGARKTAAREFTPRARQILGMASNAARERKAEQAGVEHLLLALVEDSDGVAAQVLAAFGVSYSILQSILDGETPTPLRSPQRMPRRTPRVTQSPAQNWTEWRDEMRHLSDADLDQLKDSLYHFFSVTEEIGFLPMLFPESRTLLDLVENERKRRSS